MSTHLGEAINAVQNVFQTDNDDILDFRYPIRVQIESEQMDVSGAGFVGAEAIRWSVVRGVGGTTPAAHAVGTAITAVNASTGGAGGGVSVTDGVTTVAATEIQLPAGTVTDQGGGVAGVSLIVKQIGPVHVAFGDFAPPGAEVLVGALAGDAVLWDALVIPTQDWDATTATFIQALLWFGPIPGPHARSIGAFDLLNVPAATNDGIRRSARKVIMVPEELLDFMPGYIEAGSATDPGGVYVSINTDGTGLIPTAGEADVILIIATPAS